jgi:N-acetylglucosaminyldiphosphoundecaprenol N-acetyl-beta-D-mannosaminyltransferase
LFETAAFLKIEFVRKVFVKRCTSILNQAHFMTKLPTLEVLSAPVTTLSLAEACQQIVDWAAQPDSKVVCVADAHMLVQSHLRPEFNRVLRDADMVTPDGMPLVVMLKLLGKRRQQRVAGMDIFLRLAKVASLTGTSMFFVGCTEEILTKIRNRLAREFPNLKIAGMEPLPFRPMSLEEDNALIDQINESGAGIVLVALGCPKQEFWMDQHRDLIQAVMVGIGGVFPIYAGELRRAPKWVRSICLEWAFRLLQEPRRLWHRYVRIVPLFIILSVKQLIVSLFTQSREIGKPVGRWQAQSTASKPVGLLLTNEKDR